MKIKFYVSIFIGRVIYFLLKFLKLNATTFSGKVALYLCPDFLKEMRKYVNSIILITGTNGKTTTNNLIYQILRNARYKVLSNLEGANLRIGIITSFLKNPSYYNYAFFEIDEGVFPYVFKELNPEIVVITNFFIDQLDRYREVDKTINSIYKALEESNTILVLNADDPFTVRFSTLKNKKFFFGIDQNLGSKDYDEIKESIYCPLYGERLNYLYFNFAQLGKFICNCGFSNPNYNFFIKDAEFKNGKWFFKIKEEEKEFALTFNYGGVYNLYNVISGFSVGRILDIPKKACILPTYTALFYSRKLLLRGVKNGIKDSTYVS